VSPGEDGKIELTRIIRGKTRLPYPPEIRRRKSLSTQPHSAGEGNPSSAARPTVAGWLRQRLSRFLGQAKDILLLVAIVAIMSYVGRLDYFQSGHLRELIQGFGAGAPLAFLSFCVLTTVAFIPPALPIGLGSIAFGHAQGGALALVGITTGACAAYFLGRYSAPKLINRLRTSRFERIDAWLSASNTFACMLCLRLIFFCNPTFNYLSGTIQQITPRVYATSTFLGLLPRTFMISYFFELFTKATLRETLTNPIVLSFLLPRVTGVLLLTLLVKTRTGRRVARHAKRSRADYS